MNKYKNIYSKKKNKGVFFNMGIYTYPDMTEKYLYEFKEKGILFSINDNLNEANAIFRKDAKDTPINVNIFDSNSDKGTLHGPRLKVGSDVSNSTFPVDRNDGGITINNNLIHHKKNNQSALFDFVGVIALVCLDIIVDFYLNKITDGAAKSLLDQRAAMIGNMDKDSFKKACYSSKKIKEN